MRMMAQHSPGFDPATPWLDCGVLPTRETRLFEHFKVRRRSPHTGQEHDFTRLICPESPPSFQTPFPQGSFSRMRRF